jgi:sugar/nucleoside kinase (ribokinase family)
VDGDPLVRPGPVPRAPGYARARIDLAPLPVEVADATGAGDALAAGFLLGGSLEEAGRRGLEAAARCVGGLGAMP